MTLSTAQHLEGARPWITHPSRTTDEVRAFIGDVHAQTGRTIELVASSVVLLLTHDAETLLLRRPLRDRSYPGLYTLPGGKREPGDASARETAERELREETGIVVSDSVELGTVFAVLTRRERIYEITGFKAHLPKGPRPIVTLSDENDDSLFIDPKMALERDSAGTLPLAGSATRNWLKLLNGALST